MARQEIDLTTPQPNGKMGEPTKSAWEKVNDMTLELYGDISSYSTQASISGLGVEWVNASTLRVLSGSAYVPSVSATVALSSDVLVPIAGFSSGTFGHLYLTASGTIEASPTVPSSRYSGWARTKSGDNSSRYIFTFLVVGTGVFRFTHRPSSGAVFWIANINATPLVLVSSGAATTATTVSAAGAVPVTAVSAFMSILNYGTALSYVTISNSDGPAVPSGYLSLVGPGTGDPEIPLDASRSYTYAYDGPSNTSFHRCCGYRFER